MKRKLSYLFMLVLIFAKETKSQTPQTEFVMPSPAVSAITTYLENTVNLSTGVPQISIPLYEIKSGSLSLPVSINYDASGIKVNQIATEVGLGWNLSAGGQITRNVLGLADNGSYTSIGGNTWIGPLNDAYNTVTYEHLVDLSEGTYDGIPDVFSFNANGHSVKFIKVGAAFYQLPKKDYKIEENVVEGQITYPFVITVENGDRYYFLEFEKTNTKSIAGNQNVSDQKTAWFLSKIENANRSDKIEFEYSPLLYEIENGVSHSTRFISEDPAPVFIQNVWCGNVNTAFYRTVIHGQQLNKIKFKLGEINIDVNGNSRQDLYQGPAITVPRINSMTITNNLNALIKDIKFNYSYFYSGNNNPNYKDYRLKLEDMAINDFPNNIPVKEVYKFTYNATNLPSTSSFAQDHWGYYNGKNTNQSLLPFNGINYNTPPFADREVNSVNAQAGVLTKIEHPTGGSTEFEYENNKIGQGDAYILTYINSALNFNYLSTPANACQSILLQSATSNSISITSAATVTFHASLAPCGNPANDWSLIVPHGATRVKLVNDNTNVVAATIYLNDPNILSKTVTLYNIPTGSYHLEAFVKWSNFSINADLNIATPQYTLSNNTDLTVGGLRIKKITKKDIFNTSNDIITHYHYNDPINPGHSSGQIFSLPEYKELIKLYAFDYYNMLWPSLSPVTVTDLCTSPNTVVFMPPPLNAGGGGNGGPVPPDKCGGVVWHGAYNYSSNSLNNLNTGNHVTYSFVAEVYGNSPTNGRMENYFSDFKSFPHHSYTGFDPSWRRGLLLKKRIFDAQNILKSETVNNYSQHPILNGNVPYFTGLSVRNIGRTDCISVLVSPNGYLVPTGYSFDQKEYRFPLEWIDIQSTIEHSYNPTISKAVNYFYDNAYKHLFQVKTVTADSKGNQISVYNSYPNDYTITGGALSTKAKAIKDMQLKNMLNMPVESYTEMYDASGTKIIDAQYNQYITKIINNHEYTLLESKYKLDLKDPLPSFLSIPKNITNDYSIDNLLKKVINVNKHNYNGTINEVENRSERKVAYIWDHENEYVTCKVSNARERNIAYSSFETENQGNWIYNPINVITAGNAFGRIPTGKSLYQFTQGNNGGYNAGENITWSYFTNVNNNTMKTYVVSFWFYIDPNDPNAHINVVHNNNNNFIYANGSTLGNSIKIVSDYSIGIKGFKYCELQVNMMYALQAIQDNFIIKGVNAHIDELRLYPVESKMQTATCTPLIGVNDQCDENNKIIYYNYDETTRLKIIRDQFGNIIQKNDYGIQSID